MPETYDRRKQDTDLVEVKVGVQYLVKEVDKINEKLEHDYVTQDQFEPIKKIVYGLVGTILLGVLGGLMALLLK